MSKYHGKQVCALPFRIVAAEEIVCKWDHKELTWTLTGLLPGFSATELKDGLSIAFDRITDVCGAIHQYVSNPATADIVASFGPIDQPGGVLAYSGLPCSGEGMIPQKYDTLEDWGFFDGDGPGIDFRRVASHELMHALGLPHTNISNQLENPTYNDNIWLPQPQWDIPALVLRYGPPGGTPPPPPPPSGQELFSRQGIKVGTFVPV